MHVVVATIVHHPEDARINHRQIQAAAALLLKVLQKPARAAKT